MSNVEATVVLVNGRAVPSRIYNLIVDLSDLSERLWFHSRQSHLKKHLSVSDVINQIRDLVERMEGLVLETDTLVDILFRELRLEVVGREMKFNWCGDEFELDDEWGMDSLEMFLENELLLPVRTGSDESSENLDAATE